MSAVVLAGVVFAVSAGLTTGSPTVTGALTAECTYRLTGDGYPEWSSSCDTTASPGRVGPLVMGRTTVTRARDLNYLARNPFCSNRLDGVSAGPDWRRRDGRVVAWATTKPTRKGLKVGQRISAARTLYPSLQRTGFVRNPYVDGEGWRIYSVRGQRGWLDVYVETRTAKIDRFWARAASVDRPYRSWAFDGC